MRYVLLLSVIATSFFASMGFIKPTQAATIGSHKITAVYYQAYVHDDHDADIPFPFPIPLAGEWRFGIQSAVQGYTWTGEISVLGPKMVDFSDRSRSWYISGNTWFRCRAEEYDGLIGVIDWLDYYSYTTISVAFPGVSVNTWHTDSKRAVDVTHYYRYFIENLAPTANPIDDQFVSVGVPVSFSGSSSDPEGDSLSYEWDFGDNETSTEQNPAHTYAYDGNYTVSFRVKDYFGEYSDYKYANVTVTHVIIDQMFVSDDRCDVGSTQTVNFHAKWAHNDSDIVGGSIYVNETEYVTDGTGWISLNPVYDTVGKRMWNVTGVNCTDITVYEKAVSDPYIIWDKVDITLSVTEDTIEVGDTASITHTAVYQYDGADFDGTITLNDTLTKSTVETYYYTTQSISGDTHGITEFESNTVAVTFVEAATTVFPWWILGVVGAVIAGIVVTALLLWRRKASKGP